MIYVALLHSIVLAPGRRLLMADLRNMAEELGYGNCRTLVATGNLLFETEGQQVTELEEGLEQAFRNRFGKSVDIIVRTASQWNMLVAANPFADGQGAQVIVRVMRQPLARTCLDDLARLQRHERLALVDGDLWIDFMGEPAKSRLPSALTTKRLGVGTMRNANTVRGLAALIGDGG